MHLSYLRNEFSDPNFFLFLQWAYHKLHPWEVSANSYFQSNYWWITLRPSWNADLELNLELEMHPVTMRDCQLSSTLIVVWLEPKTWNLIRSNQDESWWDSLAFDRLNFHLLSCTLDNFELVQWGLMRNFACLAGNIQSTLINSHATLVFVWPGHHSWEN